MGIQYINHNLYYGVTVDVECEQNPPVVKMSAFTQYQYLDVKMTLGENPIEIDPEVDIVPMLYIENPVYDPSVRYEPSDPIAIKSQRSWGYIGRFFKRDDDVIVLRFNLDEHLANLATYYTGRLKAFVSFRTGRITESGVPNVSSQVFYIDIEGFGVYDC